MTLALADANTGRLLRTLSLGGPTTADALTDKLGLPIELIHQLLHDAATLGAVRLDERGRYQVEPSAVIALVRQNRVALLGAVVDVRDPFHGAFTRC